MLETMLDWSQIEPEMVRPISRHELGRMAELGMVVDWFVRELVLALARAYWVRAQGPFAASDVSQPEPDITVFDVDPERDGHPTTARLVIEVADSSLKRDRGMKRAIYAEARVPEYWIVDLTTMTVEVYTEPSSTDYASVQHLRDGDTLRPTLLPGVELAVAEIPR